MDFQNRFPRAKAFAPYLIQTIAEELGDEFDAVTYVPISALRRFRRGFDQTALLARYTAAAWNVKLEKTLYKIRNNPPQSSVETAWERRKNVENVFRTVNRTSIAGRRVLLLDDITTSGSTLEICADLLMQAGAKSVVCAALAGSRSKK